MTSIYTQSDANRRRSWYLMTIFVIIIVILGYIFSYAFNSFLILYIAIIFSFSFAFISYWFSDKMVLSMSKAKAISEKDSPELYHLVENLCITAGLPLPKIYLIQDEAPNAFSTGRNKEHAVVVVTSGLLNLLDKTELEGVLAHELSHIGNRDIQLATLVTILVGIIVLLADWFRNFTIWGGRGSSDNSSDGQLGEIMMIVALILSILAPLFAYLMQFAISRKREYLADADGALLTRYPEGLARALEKIAQDNRPLREANRATAHLYIASPFKTDTKIKRAGWLTRMMATHPPIQDRIKRLRQM